MISRTYYDDEEEKERTLECSKCNDIVVAPSCCPPMVPIRITSNALRAASATNEIDEVII